MEVWDRIIHIDFIKSNYIKITTANGLIKVYNVFGGIVNYSEQEELLATE